MLRLEARGFDVSPSQALGSCQSDFLLRDLLQDIFMGNEVSPRVRCLRSPSLDFSFLLR